MKPLHLISNPLAEGEPKFGIYEELHYVDLWMNLVMPAESLDIFQLTYKNGTKYKVENETLAEAKLDEWLFREVSKIYPSFRPLFTYLQDTEVPEMHNMRILSVP
jgi:hypothetical protein